MKVLQMQSDHAGLHQVQKQFLYPMKTCGVETLYHYNHCLLRECSKPLMTIIISKTVAMSLYAINALLPPSGAGVLNLQLHGIMYVYLMLLSPQITSAWQFTAVNLP